LPVTMRKPTPAATTSKATIPAIARASREPRAGGGETDAAQRGAVVALNDRKPLAEWPAAAQAPKTEGVGCIAGELPSWLLDQIGLVVRSASGESRRAVTMVEAVTDKMEAISQNVQRNDILTARVAASMEEQQATVTQARAPIAAAVLVVSDTAEPEPRLPDMYSPTLPAVASSLVLVDCVGSRESQLATIATAEASAESRATVRIRVMVGSRCD